jgi:hypothetical protein
VPFGLNTDVERGERVFHVQTEAVHRSEPAVETLIFAGGEVLVRMTVACADLTAEAELTDNDVRHVLELQHWNLVRKIQHGMLDQGIAPGSVDLRSSRRPVEPLEDSTEMVIAARAEPGVRELLEDLERRIIKASAADLAAPKTLAMAARPEKPSATPATSWWRRLAHRIVVTLRW